MNGLFFDFAAERHQDLSCFIGNMRALHNLNQLHNQCRIEEMEVDNLCGTAGCACDFRADNIRAVGSQNGVSRSNLVQIGEDFTLQVDSFENGFDNQIGIACSCF